MSLDFSIAAVPAEIWRVGRAPDPWAWPDWAFAGTDGTFGCRWDDANGLFRVLYASSQRFGCFLEALAPLRPDPAVLVEFEEIAGGAEDDAVAGMVPLDWCYGRMVTKGRPAGVRGVFVDVGASRSLAVLRGSLAARVVHFGLPDLDAASIRLNAPRAFTQEIATSIAAERDRRGVPYAGVFYLSRLGDEIENWAIFERRDMDGESPVVMSEQESIDPDDHDLIAALRVLGLRFGSADPAT